MLHVFRVISFFSVRVLKASFECVFLFLSVKIICLIYLTSIGQL